MILRLRSLAYLLSRGMKTLHLRIRQQNALGVQVSVYNVNAKKWIAPSKSVETIEQGKLKAATYAETYLRPVANLELPPLQWKESRAA